MARITVVPSGLAFDARPQETIIQAAWRNGYFWPTICKGHGTCKTCVFTVEGGGENLSSIEAWERESLDVIGPTLPRAGVGSRLACQARVSGDIRVRKIGVRKIPDGNSA
jgi:2Fe-2S ferredoxin